MAVRSGNPSWRDPRRARRLTSGYAAQLSKIARQIGVIIKPFNPQDFDRMSSVVQLLHGYAEILQPWAEATALHMLEQVNQRDKSMWEAHAREISRGLRLQVQSAPIGARMRELLAEQVDLIQSIPRDAAERVHRLSQEALVNGARAAEIATEISQSEEVALSRARLIARTEVSRAAETLTQARAEHIGSPGYIWRTADDGDVREAHRKMEGKVVSWGTPPIFQEGKRTYSYHAGCFPNCRCYAEPLITTT